MTIPDLIDRTLRQIRLSFYGSDPQGVREFCRDRQALLKAIARYGYACQQRGWELEAEFIQSDLVALLGQLRKQPEQREWFPIYLEGAVDRRIRLRSEELSAEAKRIDRKVSKVVGKLQPGEIRERTTTETLALLYRQLRTGRPRKAKARPVKQLSLI